MVGVYSICWTQFAVPVGCACIEGSAILTHLDLQMRVRWQRLRANPVQRRSALTGTSLSRMVQVSSYGFFAQRGWLLEAWAASKICRRFPKRLLIALTYK